MQSLKDITPQEKAATMIEFGDFFYKDKPLSTKLKEPAKKQAPVKKAPALQVVINLYYSGQQPQKGRQIQPSCEYFSHAR